MLLFLVLCGFLQTLWGKPLPPPLGPSVKIAANATCITACECPAVRDDGSQQLRSVYDIVQSCLFTIFACVWTSIHPNINGPRDSWWARMKRRMVTMFYAVLAPELVLLWALNQRFSAKEIADMYNKEFKTLGETKTSTWAKFRQLFRPLPKSTTRRSAKQPWTITHGFFIQMGGLILYDGEYPKKVLDYNSLVELVQKKEIDIPTITERDLEDKSKGDTISKGIIVLQATWFVLQCIVRMAQHLPLSELEVLTLAFAVLNGAIYAAWWSKPQGVDIAICVPLKKAETGGDGSPSVPASSQQTDNQQSDEKEPLVQPSEQQQSNEHIRGKDSWLQRSLRKDRTNHSSLVFFLVRVPCRVTFWMLRPIGKMLNSPATPEEDLRLSMFYVGKVSVYLPEYTACVVGIVFGGVHFLGWTLEFPSPHDRILWQISAMVLTVAPFVLLYGILPERGILGVLRIIGTVVFAILSPFYIAARFVVIVIAFKAIIHPPHSVLFDISWTRYIPHF